ncbi:MAG: HlyD family type I secretion periplasmic adaptor subunit [Pseudohongiellaceae bacterium]
MTNTDKSLPVGNAASAQPPGNNIMTSMEGPKRIGLLVFFLVFGVFGLWSALAPLDGAAYAPGSVTVKSYKKTVQHLEGGIVSEILVRDGDRVQAGDPLLVLDDTQPLAQLEIARSQSIALRVREARLIAERDGLAQVVYPESLSPTDPRVAEEIGAQNAIFAARKSSLDNNVEILEQRIEQLESQVVGLQAVKKSKEMLAASFAEELADTQALLSRGFSDKNRLRELERSFASYEGEAAELTSTIASTEVQIGETRLQILQQERELQNEVVNQLSEVQTNLKDINERIIALEHIVSRTVVRSPEAGIVNGMQVHTIGGVIAPRSPIAEIVPATDELIVQGSVSPNDIDRVSEGQEATIRFSAFGSSVPTITGNVLSLSADAMTNENTGAQYYQARIEVTPDGMEELGDLILLPGMPAEVFINTGSRTFLQYLFKPFSNAMARSFNED